MEEKGVGHVHDDVIEVISGTESGKRRKESPCQGDSDFCKFSSLCRCIEGERTRTLGESEPEGIELALSEFSDSFGTTCAIG